MPKVSPIQSNFITGEISPILYGRVDSQRYATSLATCQNYIPMIQGGLTRRPGTYFAAQSKFGSSDTDTSKARLIDFVYSTEQAYVLEFGHTYIRFYRNHGPILSGGVPYEVSTLYQWHELFQIKYAQTADVLYIVHPNHPPRKLTRTDHTNWTLTDIDFQDGPYMDQNVGAITLTPSATTGVGISITASAAVFASTDIGRLVRIRHSGTWGWAKITHYTSSTLVGATVISAFGGTTAVTLWRLGLWSETTGYPSTVTFHEDRLVLGGSKLTPLRGDMSQSGEYENFSPTDPDGTVKDSSAVAFVLAADKVNNIRWMSSDEKGLMIGTIGNEFMVGPASSNAALSPTNIRARRTSAHGSADVQPVKVGKATMFVQSAGRKLRDLQYYYDVDGYRAADLTLISEHITKSGIKQLAFQKEPQQIVWAVRNDGALIGMTYERDEETLQVGWHRHIIGGVSDSNGTPAMVESIATIPSPDGTREELWMVVKRYINNGTIVRSVEYMEKFFEDEELPFAFFVDSGMSLDVPIPLSEIDVRYATITVASNDVHGLVTGDKVRFYDLKGGDPLVNKTFEVTVVDTTTFTFTGPTLDVPLDEAYPYPYINNATARKLVSTVSGLTHLEGETVSVLADGAVLSPRQVVAGAITLTQPAAVIHVGHGYKSDGKMNRIEAGSADGTALGKKRRINYVSFLLHRSLGLKFGSSFDELSPIIFRKGGSDNLSSAPRLFSGIIGETFTADYDTENNICWRQDQPLPSTILAIMPQMTTQDRG